MIRWLVCMYCIFVGLRAVMGAGYCRMNELTIIQTTQVSVSQSVSQSCMCRLRGGARADGEESL